MDILIDAFAQLSKHHSNCRLWIVGDSNEREQLENNIKANQLNDKVTLWGSKFGEDKDALIRQFDVFAHPSRNEGLPASVLEASSMGIPCVISEATNLGDIVKDYNAGIVIQNEGANALYNAFSNLYELWNAKQLEEYSKNASRMVAKAFNWNYIITEFDKLYSI